MPDLAKAITDMFTAFGRRSDDGRAEIYLNNLKMEISCKDCAAVACHQAVLERNSLPSYRQLFEQSLENQRSGVHSPHILQPQLAPMTETFWRSDAVKMILPRAEGDRDLAAFIAAQMWWNGIPQFAVPEEMQKYGETWVRGARAFLDGKPTLLMVQRAFERARWNSEHDNLDDMPSYVLELEPAP